MSFLHYNFDLTDSGFDHNDLNIARSFVKKYFSNAGLSRWMESPIGILGRLWSSKDAYKQMLELIFCIMQLDRRLDVTSRAVLLRKVAVLAAIDNQKQFEEMRTELFAGIYLVTAQLPTFYEEAATKQNGEVGRPDFKVRLSGKEIIVDATFFNLPSIEDWETMTWNVASILTKKMAEAKQLRAVYLEMPFLTGAASGWQVDTNLIRRVTDSMIANREGEISLPRPDGKALVVRWNEPPLHDDTRGISIELARNQNGIGYHICSIHSELRSAGVIQFPEIDAGDWLLNAIRSRLDAKRKQLPHGSPIALMIQHRGNTSFRFTGQFEVNAEFRKKYPNPAFGLRFQAPSLETMISPDRPLTIVDRLPSLDDAISELVMRRVWPNKMYRRLGAICPFTINFIRIIDGRMSVGINEKWMVNPYAELPIPDAFIKSVSIPQANFVQIAPPLVTASGPFLFSA